MAKITQHYLDAIEELDRTPQTQKSLLRLCAKLNTRFFMDRDEMAQAVISKRAQSIELRETDSLCPHEKHYLYGELYDLIASVTTEPTSAPKARSPVPSGRFTVVNKIGPFAPP